jgi:RNA polymerase sigma-70 factor (ECF subfamily)
MNADEDDQRLDPAVVAALYAEHAAELRRFLLGVLRDADLAGDVLQTTFTRAVELGHTARNESLKGWLFRVAYHEALAVRRKEGVRERAARRLAWTLPTTGESPEEEASRWETVQRVRAAMDELPAEQRQVVHMRIYEEKTFATIAAEVGVPLGTVLSRMQLALRKLRQSLERFKG